MVYSIPIGQELLVWYAPQYAKKLGKSVTPDGVSKGKETYMYILQHHQRYPYGTGAVDVVCPTVR